MSAAETRAEALGSLPHEPPFRFVSRVTELEPGVRGAGVWEVTGDEEFFAGHFPGEPVVPGVLLAEALAQLAGIVGLAGPGPARRARLAQVEVKFPRAVCPPASIALRARLAGAMGPLMRFDVVAAVGGVPVASGAVTLSVMAREGSGR